MGQQVYYRETPLPSVKASPIAVESFASEKDSSYRCSNQKYSLQYSKK